MNIVNIEHSARSLIDNLRTPRGKVVPQLYEEDASKYAGPHRWQIQSWARWVRRAWRHRAYTRWAEQACEHIEIVGAEHLADVQAPCVFVANHQSHLDTVVVHQVLPEHVKCKLFYGAAQDRWFVKGKNKLVLKPWYQSLALGTFPILRGGGANALEYAHWLLQKAQHVFLFPEGTRATSEGLGEFKHGAAMLALQNGVPVVPIYLAGLKELRPKGSKDVVRGRVTVEILPPIEFSPGSDVAAATDCIYRRLNRAHAKYTKSTSFSEAA